MNKGETLFQLIKRVPDAIHGLSNVNLRKLKEFFESKSLEKNDDCRSIYDQICLLVKDENKKLGSCRTTIYTVSARVGDILSPEEIAELR